MDHYHLNLLHTKFCMHSCFLPYLLGLLYSTNTDNISLRSSGI
uniref:Uncharacterized protein n=1 Tax=Setaria italica TaxID=4555 RepID=K3Y4E1_SETIT